MLGVPIIPPTNKLPETPTPPLATNAPVDVDVETVDVLLIVTNVKLFARLKNVNESASVVILLDAADNEIFALVPATPVNRVNSPDALPAPPVTASCPPDEFN